MTHTLEVNTGLAGAPPRHRIGPVAIGRVGHWGVPGDKREVPPTLRVSNHYEPNDRYHMNTRKRPICPPISSSTTAFTR
jgi:hypothetical protein